MLFFNVEMSLKIKKSQTKRQIKKPFSCNQYLQILYFNFLLYMLSRFWQIIPKKLDNLQLLKEYGIMKTMIDFRELKDFAVSIVSMLYKINNFASPLKEDLWPISRV